ncbi:hypothetical protein LY90DRAFT_502415 [Neocallimastix californiae]|jgi:hypothetical protein|uniref:AAA domain-containing protein n=1 Tax=Neocallimastix californiae TaxID=1754190 RepID=A0A1Y2ETY2_9FUNG|nr:hypothetical protein LY90DRAFT_502415 [Neocallimastix californiae]|eukprot:ORY74977.1 hypothetical protein LY90DRAFT_502415 [Neocallimastix californiae]
MFRNAMKNLEIWKKTKRNKPLIIKGERQVGKTWLMIEFGKKFYKNVAYFSFDNSPMLDNLFRHGMDVRKILDGLSIAAGFKISPKNTLIIFDEIQENPMAMTSLKNFCENAPEYDVIAAGSLLGVSEHKGTGFPVGKVDYLNLYPLNFQEFLFAIGEEQLLKIIQDNNFEMQKVFKDKIIDLLRRYLYVGGMPAIVGSYAQNQDYQEVRRLQINLLADYENDFSKHISKEHVERTRLLWNAIPS